ncbi:uncharacterized protein PFL1_02216 [Pseudozyma flocculosa PF-1]|uniref:Uncharacterized protein n=1 Tax=Pseudozyma flocculosa TaxID=84751 RepID=A0A5C3FCT8_9BASI|nr:uncharacterized protein PFL1_02216 [Pseudozyma flocculosa PF-1]EPQ30099.1 hypothetical protein PFL1_02216 [Pseudozyma flocculosa PF-1]SPO41447.1 uncharacterized protein PSFLO_06929 [Pseudozyma flocculosa]
MPLFVLSPASLAHSALFAGYYSYLGASVISLRMKTGLTLGEGDSPSIRLNSKSPNAQDDTKLKQAVRAHANFNETVPLGFFLIFLAELNGAPTSLVHAAYTTLFLSRVAHALGITAPNASGRGRPIGAAGTLLVTLGAGLYNLNLGWEPLKSFLGFK